MIDLNSGYYKDKSSAKRFIDIYNTMIAIIPGETANNIEVCKYEISVIRCKQVKQDNPYGRNGEAEMKKKPGNQWMFSPRIKRDKQDPLPELLCNECCDKEAELVFYINRSLRIEKSPWRLAVVNSSPGTDSVFGIIALTKEQLEELHRHGDPLFAFNIGYITPGNTNAIINQAVASGILSHLTSNTIDSITKTALQHSFTAPNEILALFPGVLYTFEWNTSHSPDYMTILNGLAKISRGHFNPKNIHSNTNKAGGNTFSNVSFELNQTKVNEEVFTSVYESESFLLLVNKALSDAGAKGRFYYLYHPATPPDKAYTYSFIFLDEAQHRIASDNNIISFAPIYVRVENPFPSSLNRIEATWEYFYTEEK